MIKKPILIKKKKHVDKRGYFQEVYLYKEFGYFQFTGKQNNVSSGVN